VKIPEYSLKQLDEIKNDLNLRFHGLAVDWLLPFDLKGLIELTEEMGYENAGQTIDWLLTAWMGTERILNFTEELGLQNDGQAVNLSLQSEAGSVLELTRELGFDRGGETVDWLLEMATNPMLELINLLGFKDGVKTIEWLLHEAQPFTAAIKNGFNPHASSTLPSAMNIPPELNTSTSQFPGNGGQFHNPNAQSHQQQRWDQFHSSGTGHQAENPFFNGNEGIPNLNNGVKRRRKETRRSNHVGNQLESQYPSGHRGNQATSHIERATVNHGEGLSQNHINGVDVGCAEGFQGGPTYLAGIPDVHVQNNRVVMGNTCQQNESRHFPDPKALVDYYFSTQNLFDNIHHQNQNQFENNHDQNQNQIVNINEQKQKQFVNIRVENQNQFGNILEQNSGTDVKQNQGRHGVPQLSNEGTVNTEFVNDKAL
jgi:hypothetical protein